MKTDLLKQYEYIDAKNCEIGDIVILTNNYDYVSKSGDTWDSYMVINKSENSNLLILLHRNKHQVFVFDGDFKLYRFTVSIDLQ